MTRISLDLDDALLERLEAQAEAMEVPRSYIISAAVTGVVRDLEAIDVEYPPETFNRRTSNSSIAPRRPQRGSATLEFMLVIGLLVFPMAGLVSVTSWPERLNAAHAAAYEAARAVIEAPEPSAGMDLGRQRALEVLSNHGFSTDDVSVSFSPSSPGRGEPLTATVTITLPALTFPGVTTWDAVRSSKSSTQRVGDFREFR